MAKFFTYQYNQLPRKPRAPDIDIAAIIDESVKRYKNRHRSDLGPSIFWHCVSRKLTFGISLSKSNSSCPVTMTFYCKLPYSFEYTPARRFYDANNASTELLTGREIQRLAEALNYFDYITVHSTGVIARRGNFEASRWHAALPAIITFVRYVMEYETHHSIQASGEAICPYCRSKISDSEPLVSCRECRTQYHSECWEEIGHCSVFGCRSRKEIAL